MCFVSVALYILIIICWVIYWIFSPILTAVEFLKSAPEGRYDAIIVDSSDPVGMPFLFKIIHLT